MKNWILVFLALSLSVGCGNSDMNKPKSGNATIAALYKNKEGGYTLDAMLRIINKSVAYDSSNKKDVIKYDTLWGYPQFVPATDSTGKPILDTSGKQQIRKFYLQIGKDSVLWDISNKNLDSLIQKIK